MSGERPLLSRGRGGTFLFAGALVSSFAAGWIRRPLLVALTNPLVALPWIPLRRLVLGLLFDLPTALVIVVVCAIAGWIFVLRPWPTALSLTVSVWLLDALVSWLVLDDFGLWTDPLVIVPRIAVAVATAFGAALVLGWRPRRRSQSGREESPASETGEVNSAEEV